MFVHLGTLDQPLSQKVLLEKIAEGAGEGVYARVPVTAHDLLQCGRGGVTPEDGLVDLIQERVCPDVALGGISIRDVPITATETTTFYLEIAIEQVDSMWGE